MDQVNIGIALIGPGWWLVLMRIYYSFMDNYGVAIKTTTLKTTTPCHLLKKNLYDKSHSEGFSKAIITFAVKYVCACLWLCHNNHNK